MHRLKSRNVCSVRLVLNGKTVVAEATPRMLLSDFLREKLGMMGVHIGCEHGVCGVCTVRIDGALARACLTFGVQADGSAVDTVEGLAPELGRLSVLQAAFRRHHALQCGFCTPGILVSFDTLLSKERAPDESQIKAVLSGHLCRCTGYRPIIEAVLDAARILGEESQNA